jgi:hypothetical protein
LAATPRTALRVTDDPAARTVGVPFFVGMSDAEFAQINDALAIALSAEE